MTSERRVGAGRSLACFVYRNGLGGCVMFSRKWKLVATWAVCATMGVALAGCERVSISYHDHQPRHHHAWAARFCADCGGECDYCAGCHEFRHRTVRVRIEHHPPVVVRHAHHYVARWCDRCGARCRFCDGCDEVHHVGVSVRLEVPRHTHAWTWKLCKACKRECRFCTGCGDVLHAKSARGPVKAHQHVWKAAWCDDCRGECRICTTCKLVHHRITPKSPPQKGKGRPRD